MRLVAPHVGAWIETLRVLFKSHVDKVAPHVGAWIETYRYVLTARLLTSHPMWVRGLKLSSRDAYRSTTGSHPMWVRGLKQYFV